jgi:hypothetical protein
LVKILEVSAVFVPYVGAAITRLKYLHKEIDFSFDGGVIWAARVPETQCVTLRSEVAHALYREKILLDSAPLRQAIYTKLLGR